MTAKLNKSTLFEKLESGVDSLEFLAIIANRHFDKNDSFDGLELYGVSAQFLFEIYLLKVRSRNCRRRSTPNCGSFCLNCSIGSCGRYY